MQRDLATQPHHPAIEAIVDILTTRVQNQDRPFFRVMTAYFFGKMASSQRTTILTKDRGAVPVNLYTISLATSGAGKGHSVSLLENEITGGFKSRFVNDCFPMMAENNLWNIAKDRALRNGTVEKDEFDKAKGEFHRQGALVFTFDSGTAPAVKQMRYKLLMADLGAINFQVDEIGANFVNSEEVMNVFLELYDQGQVKQKLTKSTAENQRGEELDGKTPANMLLFGTPANLLNGSKTEELFYTALEIGYGRRCLFAYGSRHRASETMTPEQIYRQLADTSIQSGITHWAQHCSQLADPAMSNWKVFVEDDVGIELMTYKIECERLADAMPEHEEIRKSEMSHRYFKALKLAGAMAFFDQKNEIDMDTLYYAIKLVEESGVAFERIFTREKNYVKLAKFLASVGTEQTHADLTEALPFYKGSQANRNELITLATAWGYKNHVIIKKLYEQGIEFYTGESLTETSLDKIIVSYSDHMAYRYRSEMVPFNQLHVLTQQQDYHWINHALPGGAENNGHRAEENCVPGFNAIVVDVDKGTSLDLAKELLKDYSYLMYTTKRHQQPDDKGVVSERFRIVLPINYHLKLDADDYRDFMANIFSWLPFEVDETTNQRSRKWLTHPGQHFYNEGQLLDALKFIPQTSKNEEYKQSLVKLENLPNLERWFAQRMVTGSRNNHMIRFALTLVDMGLGFNEIEQRVLEFNAKLDNKLPDDELRQTVLKTVASKLQNPHPHP